MLPELSKMFPKGDGIFQHDLAPCHTARRTRSFVEQNNTLILSWSGNSPDINAIENLWSVIKARLKRFDCGTMEKLIASVIQVWFHDDELKKICCTLVESMPNCVRSVIAARGGHTNY